MKKEYNIQSISCQTDDQLMVTMAWLHKESDQIAMYRGANNEWLISYPIKKVKVELETTPTVA
jgi:hypothetical protein